MTITELNSTFMDSEETALAPREDTVIAPSKEDTVTEVPAYAWSLAETVDLDAPTERYSWGATCVNAGVLISAAVLAVISIAIVGWLALSHHSAQAPAAMPPIVAPAAPQQAAPPVAPPAIPDVPNTKQEQPVSPDTAFITAIQAEGITFNNPQAARQVAHEVCRELAAGGTQADVAAAVVTSNPGFPEIGAKDFVHLATVYYCPQGASA